jgi:hypothetical protein
MPFGHEFTKHKTSLNYQSFFSTSPIGFMRAKYPSHQWVILGNKTLIAAFTRK